MRKFYLLLIIGNTYAATSSLEATHPVSRILLLGFLIIAALFSLIVHKYRQSSVLSQLVIGALIGILAHFHITFFAEIVNNDWLGLIAQLGSIFLLFEIGLESNFKEIQHAGKYGLQVAIIGAIVPFCLGYFLVAPYIIGDSSHKLALFVGGILAVTSTSISVSIFKELGVIRQLPCQIVLTASVIDDIIGLILLSVIATTVSVNYVDGYLLLLISTKVISFFIIWYIMSKFILPKILIPQLSKLGTGEHTVTLFIVAICLTTSWFAETIGLAEIIGAFFAGLMLKSESFHDHGLLSQPRNKEYNKSLIGLILPLGRILTPIFFIYAGMQVDLVNMFNPKTIITAVLISIVAIISKLACSITLPKRVNRLMVGFGMVPRGEIGIIFAITGLNIGVIDNGLLTTLLLVIVITSIVTPIALNTLIRKQKIT